MNILITGGCGYIGCETTKYLLEKEEISKVVLYDNLSKKNPNFFFNQKLPNKERIQFVDGDILNTYELEKILNDVNVVLHLAAKVSTPFADRDSHGFDQVNNWGTSILCSRIEEVDRIQKIIYASSTSVYGNTRGDFVDESSATLPRSFYGVSKLKGERHVKRLKNKNPITVRLGNIFGHNRSIRMDGVLNRFMFEAHYKGKIEIHGTGNQKRAFTEIETVGSFLADCCINESKSNLLNLVDYNLSINEISKVVKELYPDLEFLYMDQQMEMRSISVGSIYRKTYNDPMGALFLSLQKMKNIFSF